MTTIQERDIQLVYEAATEWGLALPYTEINATEREFYRNRVLERLAWIAPEWATQEIVKRAQNMYFFDRKRQGAPKEQKLEWRLASATAKTAYCLLAKGMFDLSA